MFCSEASYVARRGFYSGIFGKPASEGEINEGSGNRKYWGSTWHCQSGLLFALLKNSDLGDSEEVLAHIGFMFDSATEFDVEIQRRDIDKQLIKTYRDGQRQIFVRDKNGVELELGCTEVAK
jgi:catechol 2,3-dioxygenase-like lactoylglutathione lyase family enzyme